MADIRINALANTATSAASDDYLAIDGSANGTRKILATNVAQNVTDVTFGSSGPSAKSSIAARAARQGLVFDGTAGATVAFPAVGTNPVTFSFWINTSTADKQILGGSVDGVSVSVNSSGYVRVAKQNTAFVITGTKNVCDGKSHLVVWTRTGTTETLYVDGIVDTTATDASAVDFSATSTKYGAFTDNSAGVVGTLGAPYYYNRALSAAEVVALYEAGVPAGTDYNPASNAAVPSGGTYAKWFGTGTVSSGTASSFTVDAGASGLYVRNINRYTTAKKGSKYRVSLTITGTITGIVGFEGTGASDSVALAGSGDYVITCTTSGDVNPVFECTSVAGGTITITAITSLGLLLAPDAGQAGGGLTWYDTSGNAANITLPASGVTWNVPTSSKVATGWSFGNTTSTSSTSPIRISTGGTYGTTFANGFKSLVYEDTSGNLAGVGITGSGVYLGSSYSNPVIFVVSSSEISRFTNSGNLLLKSDGVDSSNGKLQLATHTTSAGGIGFGTDVSLFRAGTKLLNIAAATANYLAIQPDASTYNFQISTSGSDAGLRLTRQTVADWDITAGSSFIIKKDGTTALTLDSSQNATFAGRVDIKGGAAGIATSTFRLGFSSNESLLRSYGADASTQGSFVFTSLSSDASLNTNALRIEPTLTTFNGSIKTAAPAGGTAANWKLGTVATVSPTSPNRTIEVDIGGTIYYIHAKTTNN